MSVANTFHTTSGLNQLLASIHVLVPHVSFCQYPPPPTHQPPPLSPSHSLPPHPLTPTHIEKTHTASPRHGRQPSLTWRYPPRRLRSWLRRRASSRRRRAAAPGRPARASAGRADAAAAARTARRRRRPRHRTAAEGRGGAGEVTRQTDYIQGTGTGG